VSGLLLNPDNLDALPTHRDFIALGLSEQSAGQRCVVRQGAVGRIGLISTDDAIRLLLAVAVLTVEPNSTVVPERFCSAT